MQKIIQKYNDVMQSLFFTFLFGFAAHGYRFLHAAFSHDSLLIYQDEAVVQTALGRFLQPVYWQLRGHICAPFLIGVLALLFLGLAVALLGRALEVRTWYGRMLICGLTAVNAPFTLTSATYIPWLDIFMLSFLLCAASIWLFQKYRYGFLLGAVPVCLAMGLYQSYFQAAVALYMILVIKTILDGKEPAEVLCTGIKAICTLGLGIIGYYIVYRLVLQIGNIPPADTYNGLSGVGDFSEYSIPKLVGETYRTFFRSFLHPETVHVTLTRMSHIALLVLSCGGVFWLLRKNTKPLNILMLAGIVLLFPFGANIAYFISKGSGHTLMEFSFSMVYVLVVLVLERCADKMVRNPGWAKAKTGVQWVAGILLLAIVFHNTIFANQAYLKKDLNYEATMSAMTRLIDRMEQVDGYVIGQTPVVILGTFDDLGIMSARPGYERQNGLGFYTNSAITYEATYEMYFQNVLGYPVNLLSGSERERYAALPEVQDMPAYPKSDSCRMVDGVLVIKLA